MEKTRSTDGPETLSYDIHTLSNTKSETTGSTVGEPPWDQAPAFGRRENFLRALQRLYELYPGPVCIMETGTARDENSVACSGDGWSTVAWGWYCSQTGGRVYTVDISAGAIAACQRLTAAYADSIEYVCENSIDFLSRWSTEAERQAGELSDSEELVDSEESVDSERRGGRKVHFLYLDSLDYFDHAQSEAHHLAEAKAILPALAIPSLILIDDTSVTFEAIVNTSTAVPPTPPATTAAPEGTPAATGVSETGSSLVVRGKGAKAIPFLIDQGFAVEWSTGGQVLLCRC